MRSNKTNSRRNSNALSALVVGMAIVIGGAGTVAALAALKIVDPVKLAFWRSKPVAPPIPTGLDRGADLRENHSRPYAHHQRIP